MPEGIAQQINRALATALKDEDLRKAFAKYGIEARGTSLDEASKVISAEYLRWKEVIEAAGIKETK